MQNRSRTLSVMEGAARSAGRGLLRRFRDRAKLEVRAKGRADFVSEADLESEQVLRTILLRELPECGFVSEESEAAVGIDPTARFIVDPLDGTTNFLSGIPHFAVAIALERQGRTVAGVVFDVPKDEMFVAELGAGAWLGKERLRVSADADFSRAVVATGIPHASAVHRHSTYLPQLEAVMREAAGVRRFAAAAIDLAYVASGRFAAFFEVGLAPWDVAAGALLVQEAGGRVTTLNGQDDFVRSREVLATNGLLHEPMVALL